ncbi:hypothetical protein BJ546DRAFT_19772 [Cryomyces antarcticus]
MPTIAISGGGSGIGHTFVTAFAKDSKNHIHAIDVAFSDEASNEKAAAKVERHTVDTSKQSSVDELAAALDGEPIDLFIHSAAVRGLVQSETEKSDNPSDAETMAVMDVETMTQALQVNVVGSFLLMRALVPNLGKAKGARCVVMGSRMGSVGANDDGGAYAYRASKAGLNALVKSFAIDVPDVVFTVIHPGRVESRMTHVREDGAVDAEQAIDEMLPLIEKLGKDDSGKFYIRGGDEIPW